MKKQDETSSETCPLLLTSHLVGYPLLEEMVPIELVLSKFTIFCKEYCIVQEWILVEALLKPGTGSVLRTCVHVLSV